jgi:S-methylmethionine-dependent homocysteine/selenocysteine methylase
VTTLEWCFRPDLSPEEQTAEAEYRLIAQILLDAGADLLLLETVNNVSEAAVAARAAREVGLPVWVAFVCDSHGYLFSGETLAKAADVLVPIGVDAILLNCAPPPDIEAGLEKLLAAASCPTGAYPHIGRFDPPEWLFTAEYPPARYAEVCKRWRQMGARILGGCCGTTPEHIRAMAEAM